jgi:hypothetical protein
MIHHPRRVPKNVEFKVRWLPFVDALKSIQPRSHGFLSGIKSLLRIVWISARPKLRPDLEAGNFPNRPNGVIIVAAFNHGKRFPAIHCERRRRQPKAD